MPPEVAAASQSAHLGGYVKIQKVGTGSMGEVFKAWDQKEGRWVALKILRSNDMTQLARFVREAQVASGMNHPNITRIFDAGKDKGMWFIAMQFVAGHTLRAFPRTSRRISVELMRDAARALDYAHGKGTVHRDLKPENFMVQSKPKPGGNAKSIDGCTHHIFVMDFGIARPSDASTQLTIPGTVMGSPSFMSPEQASGREVDHRTDVYALGATLYDRLCGKPPFESKNIFEGLRLVQETMPQRPRSIDPSIDPKLEAIVMKALEKDPAKRPQTATELAEALDAWLLDNPPASAAPIAAKKTGCGKAAVWLLAAGAAGAALVQAMA
ncbi:MAG: serine/threonine-protein kinase [Planctomycetota bacterium]